MRRAAAKIPAGMPRLSREERLEIAAEKKRRAETRALREYRLRQELELANMRRLQEERRQREARAAFDAT
jgi:hypothetical protein